MRILPIILLLSLLAGESFSDTKDSTEEKSAASPIDIISFNPLYFNSVCLEGLDTSLMRFHRANYLEGEHINLGHILSPQSDLFYPATNKDITAVSFNAMRNFQSLLSVADAGYCNSRIPLTEIFFITASKGEQAIDLLHTQNVSKFWNVAGRLKLLGEDGSYSNQKSSRTSATIQTNYISQNMRYGLFGNAAYDKIKIGENGGIANDSVFEEGSILLRTSVPVFLSNSDNQLRTFSVSLHHFINIGRRPDSIQSSDTSITTKVIPALKLGHQVRFMDNAVGYNGAVVIDSLSQGGADSLFYSQFFPVDSSMLVTDSAHFSVLRNEIYLTSYAQGRKSGISVKRKFYFLAGVKHDLYKYSQYVFDTAFQNLSCELDISWKPFDFVQLRARSEYGVYGYHEGDGAIWPEMTFYGKSKHFLLHINSMFTSTTPPLDVLRYHTQHIDWNNQFDAENTKAMKVRFEIPGRRFALYANYFSFGNYIYYDMQALPQQQPGLTEVAEFGIEKSMNWRHLHLDTKTAYQHSYNEELLSIPELVTCNSLYFEGPMFRKAVLVRLGVDVLYYSKYYPDAWMPLIRQYYLQGEKEVGNYPYAGALLAVKISNVRIFFRANHPYAGLMGYQYYGTPHHPMPDRTFRFGINWRFFD